MGQKKLIRFEAIKSFPNVLQYPEGMAGKWAAFYKNEHPLTLELACGKGEYTVGLAKLYPERNFLGIDMKGNRIYIGAKKSLEEKITNAAFLRTHIDKIRDYFNKGEVSEIWLTFPDPQLRKSRFTRRLTHPKFIRLYQQILKPGGRIHLKTDSPVLYQFTKWVIDLYQLTLLEDSADIHAAPMKEELKIQTHYESLDIAQSKRVHYLCFTLPEGELPEGELPEGELPEGELPEGGLPEGGLPEGELPEGELPERAMRDLDAQLHEKVKHEEPAPPERVRPPRITPPAGHRSTPPAAHPTREK